MATDAIAIVGAPPAAVGPPDAHIAPGTPTGDGRPFSKVIAAAMDGAPPSDVLPVEIAAPPAGFDVLSQLATGIESAPEPTLTPGLTTITHELRPDRDAEAEDAAAALAAYLIGGVLPRPTAAPQPTEGGIAVVAPIKGAGHPALLGDGIATPVPAPAAPPTEAATPVETVVAAPTSEYGWQPFSAPARTPEPARGDNIVPEGPEPVLPAPPADVTATAAPVIEDAPASAAPLAQLEQTPADAEPAPRVVEEAFERPVTRGESSNTGAQMQAAPVPQFTADVAAQPAAMAPATMVEATDGPRMSSALADTVQAAVLRGERELTIALNPPDLGLLEVHITEHASGGVTVAISASSSEAHDLLQQQLPALRAGLEQRDVRVERIQVEQQAASSGPGFTADGQRESGDRRGAWSSPREQQWSPIASMAGGTTSSPALRNREVVADGRVDLRA